MKIHFVRDGKLMKEKIENKRIELDKLISSNNAKLSEGKILEVSMQLDVLITTYYKESAFDK